MKKYLVQLLFLTFVATTSNAYYQAEQGRWLNRDPIAEQGGLNIYSVIGNGLVNAIDFLGYSSAYSGTFNDDIVFSMQEIEDARGELRDAIDHVEGLSHKTTDIACYQVFIEDHARNQTDGGKSAAMKAVRTGDHSFILAHGTNQIKGIPYVRSYDVFSKGSNVLPQRNCC